MPLSTLAYGETVTQFSHVAQGPDICARESERDSLRPLGQQGTPTV